MATSPSKEVKPPQHDGTPRAHGISGTVEQIKFHRRRRVRNVHLLHPKVDPRRHDVLLRVTGAAAVEHANQCRFPDGRVSYHNYFTPQHQNSAMRRLHGPQAALHGLGDLPLLFGRRLVSFLLSDCCHVGWCGAAGRWGSPGCRRCADWHGRSCVCCRGPRLVLGAFGALVLLGAGLAVHANAAAVVPQPEITTTDGWPTPGGLGHRLDRRMGANCCLLVSYRPLAGISNSPFQAAKHGAASCIY